MINVAKPTTGRGEKSRAGSREGEEDSGLQQEHKIEVKVELLVFQSRGVKGGGQSQLEESER